MIASEYQNCAIITDSTDYGDQSTIDKHNRAIDKMYEIVITANDSGLSEIEKLFPLLDIAETAKWLAHHLVEKAVIPQYIEDKCFSIVESLSLEDSPDGIGEKQWLQEWKSKKGRI